MEWETFLDFIVDLSLHQVYHLSLVKDAQPGEDNASTEVLSVKIFEHACFGMMRKPFLY